MAWYNNTKSKYAEHSLYRFDNMSGLGDINFNKLLKEQAREELNATDYVVFKMAEGIIKKRNAQNRDAWVDYRDNLRAIINSTPGLRTREEFDNYMWPTLPGAEAV